MPLPLVSLETSEILSRMIELITTCILIKRGDNVRAYDRGAQSTAVSTFHCPRLWFHFI